jgi:outer membrane immunogenic protein
LRVVLAVCALLAATSTAWSADPTSPTAAGGNTAVPPVSALPYDWAGFYLRGSGDLAAGIGQANANNPLDGLSAASSGAGNSTSTLDLGEFGANWQTGDTVVGFQGDMQWANQWTGPFSACGLGCGLDDKVKVPWLATLRARAGTTFDQVFVYGTGGLATLGTSSSNLNSGGFGTTPDFTNFSTGSIDWTVGAGMEMALDKDVSAKLEYLYMPSSAGLSPPGWLLGSGTDAAKNNVLRGGIDYRLPIGGP